MKTSYVVAEVRDWVTDHLYNLGQKWRTTGICLVPDCEVRAMNFPPSHYCEEHTQAPSRR